MNEIDLFCLIIHVNIDKMDQAIMEAEQSLPALCDFAFHPWETWFFHCSCKAAVNLNLKMPSYPV